MPSPLYVVSMARRTWVSELEHGRTSSLLLHVGHVFLVELLGCLLGRLQRLDLATCIGSQKLVGDLLSQNFWRGKSLGVRLTCCVPSLFWPPIMCSSSMPEGFRVSWLFLEEATGAGKDLFLGGKQS